MKNSKFNDIFNTFLLNEMEANDTAPDWTLNNPKKTDESQGQPAENPNKSVEGQNQAPQVELDEIGKKAADAGFKYFEKNHADVETQKSIINAAKEFLDNSTENDISKIQIEDENIKGLIDVIVTELTNSPQSTEGQTQ